MKKILCLVLAGVLGLFSACGQKTPSERETSSEPQTEETTATTSESISSEKMEEIYCRCLQKLEEKGITGEYLIAPDMQFKPLSEKGREEISALLRKMEYTPITKGEEYQSLPYISIRFSNGVEIGFVEDFLQIYFFDRKEDKGETCRVKDAEKFARELDEILSIERKI